MSKGPHSDLKIIFWFLRPYRLTVFLIFLFLLAYALLETISIGSFYPLFSSVLSVNSGQIGTGGIVLKFIDSMAAKMPFEDKLIASSFFLMVMVSGSAVFGFFAESFATWYRYKLFADFLNNVYHKILKNRYLFFLNKKQGDILYIGMNASQSVGEMLLYFPKIGVEFFRILTISAFLLTISPKVTFALFGIITVFGILVRFLSVKVIHPIAKELQTAQSEVTSVFSESTSGIRQIKIIDKMHFWYDRYRVETNRARMLSTKNVIYSYIPSRIILFIGVSSIVVSILYARLSSPELFATLLPIIAVYVLSLQRLMPSISTIGYHWMGLKSLAPRLKITYETLTDREYEAQDGSRQFEGLKHEISMEQVTFSYPKRGAAIRNVSVRMPKGKTTAIVGESGAGKSTLVDLLIGLYEPDSGKILIDGIDYREFFRASWLSSVGMVSQDTFIFHVSIRDNIRMGMPDASEEDIVRAARVAHAHDFIMEMPAGYDTIVGDRGIKMSGGQRQRIAIARAAVRKPDILILDEATSALDNISEKVVQEALKEVTWDKTTIIIAHRLSTIEHADTIIVMKKGEVVEQGTHEDLIRTGGYYRSLYEKQRHQSHQEV